MAAGNDLYTKRLYNGQKVVIAQTDSLKIITIRCIEGSVGFKGIKTLGGTYSSDFVYLVEGEEITLNASTSALNGITIITDVKGVADIIGYTQ